MAVSKQIFSAEALQSTQRGTILWGSIFLPTSPRHDRKQARFPLLLKERGNIALSPHQKPLNTKGPTESPAQHLPIRNRGTFRRGGKSQNPALLRSNSPFHAHVPRADDGLLRRVFASQYRTNHYQPPSHLNSLQNEYKKQSSPYASQDVRLALQSSMPYSTGDDGSPGFLYPPFQCLPNLRSSYCSIPSYIAYDYPQTDSNTEYSQSDLYFDNSTGISTPNNLEPQQQSYNYTSSTTGFGQQNYMPNSSSHSQVVRVCDWRNTQS